jgi:hypothetical protein
VSEEEAKLRLGVDLFVNYYDATRILISRLRWGIAVRREEIAKIKRTRRAEIVKTALTRGAAIRKAKRKG